MGKIFVVTSGEYDDYNIIGVTTDRAVAERLVNLYDDGWDVLNIEEWDDMKIQDVENEKPAWNVTIYDGGDAVDVTKLSMPYNAENFNEVTTKYLDRTVFIVPGETEEEAIEEAKKRRKEYDSNN